MIEAKNISARIGRRVLWQNVTLSVRPGQILGILGPNGVGKTTLLRCLSGLRKPNEGDISSPPAIGYVSQHFRPGQPLLVSDFAAAGLAAQKGLAKVVTSAERALVANALTCVGASHLADRPITQLSGGESKLVLIARALVSQSKLLVLDEPMAGLDLHHQADILRLFRTLAVEGFGLIWSTHDPNHLLATSHEVLLLGRDATSVLGPPQDLLQPKQLQELFRLPFHRAETEIGSHLVPDFR